MKWVGSTFLLYSDLYIEFIVNASLEKSLERSKLGVANYFEAEDQREDLESEAL
jgi:hypothetical protein